MAAVDTFSSHQPATMAPARNAFAITPHDTNELERVTRAIYVGGAGNISVVLADDSSAVTFVGLVAGSVLPICAKQVKHTDTNATYLLGLY